MEMTTIQPMLSAITPNDLGLKAAFWSRQDGHALTFRPIVGWVTVVNYAEAAKAPFVAVVHDANCQPVLLSVSTFPDFVGVFEKGVEATEAIKRVRSTGTPPPSTDPGRPLE